jgi:hypothetical protein
MFFPRVESRSFKYAPLAPHDDGEDSNSSPEKRSSEAEDNFPLVEASDNLPTPSSSSQLPKLVLYFSTALVLLSLVNIALFPRRDGVPACSIRVSFMRVGMVVPRFEFALVTKKECEGWGGCIGLNYRRH